MGYFPVQNPFILGNTPCEAINHKKGNLSKVWFVKKLNMSLSHLESGCFLARKREASESENKETVTVKLEVVIMLVENSSLRFLRVNTLQPNLSSNPASMWDAVRKIWAIFLCQRKKKLQVLLFHHVYSFIQGL